MRINTDLLLTLMASGHYRLPAIRIEEGSQVARARTLFRNFVDATATVAIRDAEIRVRFGRRAYNPMLIHAGFADVAFNIPWLEGRALTLEFGS